MADTVSQKLRPLRLAFLLSPGSKKEYLDAVKVNTAIWGGKLNPMLICHRKVTPALRRLSLRPKSIKEYLIGYMKAYDPDYYILGEGVGEFANLLPKRRVLTLGEMCESIERDLDPKVGVSTLNILEHYVDSELRFLARKEKYHFLPSAYNKHELFMTTAFGDYQDVVKNALKDEFGSELNFDQPQIAISNFLEYYLKDGLSPIAITGLYLQVRASRLEVPTCAFLLLSPNNIQDVCDFWNLRAAGWYVVPIPIDYANDTATKETIRRIIRRVAEIVGNNGYAIREGAAFVPASSVTSKQLSEFIKGLDLPKVESGRSPITYSLSSMPEFWRAHSTSAVDGVATIEHSTSAQAIRKDEVFNYVEFRELPFAPSNVQHNRSRFAIDFGFDLSNTTEPIAEVIPAADEFAVMSFGAGNPYSWRVSRKGPTCFGGDVESGLYFRPPMADFVFSRWMEAHGWRINLSSAGAITRQMYISLGGKYGTSVIANDEIVDLIRRMNGAQTKGDSSRRGLLKKEVEQWLKKASGNSRISWSPQVLLDGLIKNKVLQLGVELQCPQCSQHSWYPLDKLDYVIRCVNCLGELPIPSHSPSLIRWSYQAIGTFRLGGRTIGSITVVLVLRLLSYVLNKKLTPHMCFEATKDTRTMEIDLGALYQDEQRRSDAKPLFVECKGHMQFEKSDIEKAKTLADAFPGATLVFATLRRNLTRDEKRRLASLVVVERRKWWAGRISCEILILTGNELYIEHSIQQGWEKLGKPHSNFSHLTFHRAEDSFHQLCVATQQLYLGLDSLWEWAQARRARRGGKAKS